MPRHTSSATLDLFDFATAAPSPSPASATSTRDVDGLDLASLSDRALAQRLAELVRELKQRMHQNGQKASRPELDRAVQETVTILESLAPRSKRRRRARFAEATPVIQDAKRKAVRAALRAGLSPGQVAKHFGLPLAAVRKMSAEGD
jgi:hypothetical protein